MAKKSLVMALDFARRKGCKPGRRFYRHVGGWGVVYFGPTYENHYRLFDLSPEEVAWLEAQAAPEGESGERRA